MSLQIISTVHCTVKHRSIQRKFSQILIFHEQLKASHLKVYLITCFTSLKVVNKISATYIIDTTRYQRQSYPLFSETG